jgi:hypothetical protein
MDNEQYTEENIEGLEEEIDSDFEGIRFDTHEYEPRERTSDWYWTVSIFTLAICVISLIYGNILFAILVLISAFTLLLLAAREPLLVEVEIGPRGIKNHLKTYAYKQLTGFWIDEEAHKNTLLLKSTKNFIPLITIPLGDADPDIIHEYLERYLPVEELHEPIGQKIMERLGF